MTRNSSSPDSKGSADQTRELRVPNSGAREARGEEHAPEPTALIDAASMEGLQARSRRGESIPPPPVSEAEATSVLDTSKLSELVDESGGILPTVRPPGAARVPEPAPAAVVTSNRGKYTPTLRSADFDEKAGRPPPVRMWPLVLGILVFGGGVGTFMGARTIPIPDRTGTIDLAVQAEPRSATLRLDNAALPGNPHRSTHPRDGKRRTVIVEAPGYLPQQIDIVFDASSSIDVVLTEATPAP